MSRTKFDIEFSDLAEDLLREVAAIDMGRQRVDFTVQLPLERLPVQASQLRALARKIELVMAVRLTEGQTEAVPLSGSFAARLLGLDPNTHAYLGRRLLRGLVARGVIRRVGALEPLRGHFATGTPLFEPADTTLETLFDGVEITAESSSENPVFTEKCPSGLGVGPGKGEGGTCEKRLRVVRARESETDEPPEPLDDWNYDPQPLAHIECGRVWESLKLGEAA